LVSFNSAPRSSASDTRTWVLKCALSLYLERPKVLVAGDALTAEGGHLNGPNPPLTLDVRAAVRSVRRLADLEIDTIVCYHGGVVSEDANGQLRRVVREASRERDE
jgi:glyoxylase-like metal-dependent hydrolase (beta-lactamase superfamily II)